MPSTDDSTSTTEDSTSSTGAPASTADDSTSPATDSPTSAAIGSVGVSPAVSTLAGRYWRRTLALRSLLGLVWFLSCLALLGGLPFLPAVALIVVLLGALVAPVFTTDGEIQLRTDRDAKTVREDFLGPTPPVFGLQAALADDIRQTPDGVAYDLSALLGLRSTTMTLRADDYPIDSAGDDTTDRIHRDDDTDPRDATDSSIADANDGSDSADTNDANASTDANDGSNVVTDTDGSDLELTVTVGGNPWGHYRITTRERQGETDVVIETESTRRFSIRRLPDWFVANRYRARLFDAQGYSLLAHDSTLSIR